MRHARTIGLIGLAIAATILGGGVFITDQPWVWGLGFAVGWMGHLFFTVFFLAED